MWSLSFRAGIILLALAGPAVAQRRVSELTGTTSCADYVRMQAADTAPGADPVLARAHVAGLMREYAPYVLRSPDGRPLDTVIPFVIAYSTHWCEAHPTATVAEAGRAVGAAERTALRDPGYAAPAGND